MACLKFFSIKFPEMQPSHYYFRDLTEKESCGLSVVADVMIGYYLHLEAMILLLVALDLVMQSLLK